MERIEEKVQEIHDTVLVAGIPVNTSGNNLQAIDGNDISVF
jgi:hypothetical protein